jgi:intracellular multiplication protein IcmD
MSTTLQLSPSDTALLQVVSNASSDPAYRQQLIASPAATLQAAGVEIPAGMTVQVVQNTATTANLLLASRPAGLTDAEIEQAAASPIDTASPAASLEEWTSLTMQTWTDSALKAQLLANPAQVLAAHNVTVPAGMQAKVLEVTAQQSYVVLPPASNASASASAVDIGEIATTVTTNMTNLTKLITGSSYIAGLAFSLGSIFKFKQHKDNPTQVPLGTPVALIVVAAALLFLPTILDVTGKTMFGTQGTTSS